MTNEFVMQPEQNTVDVIMTGGQGDEIETTKIETTDLIAPEIDAAEIGTAELIATDFIAGEIDATDESLELIEKENEEQNIGYDELDISENAGIDDPVRAYFKSIGRTKLLSAD